MHPLYDEFIKVLETEDKGRAIEFVLSRLSRNEFDIVTLYTGILAPSLNEMECDGPEEFCIWKEHVRSSIIRSVIENCYPYVIREREEKYRAKVRGEKVMVLCPAEELHEIGARMVADYFTLLGYDVTFVGANTPRPSFLSAVDIIKPKYIAISVTNYYNISAARRTIDEIRNTKHGKMKIIIGGLAFARNPDTYREIGADLNLNTFSDIKKLRGRD